MSLKKEDVSRAVQLSALLEVSAPKPGNVNRYNDMENLNFEQFLGSSISIGPIAEKSFEIGKKNKFKSKIGLYIKEAVLDTNKWQTGRNPNFGIIILTVPICAALGLIEVNENLSFKKMSLKRFGEKVSIILSKTNIKDTMNFYKAIKIADPKGIKKIEKYDVKTDKGHQEIKKDNINLLKLFNLSKDREIVMRDLSENLKIIINEGYPKLKNYYEKTKNIPGSITQTFLYLLSQYEDTLITRKTTKKKSKEISQAAKQVIDSGGYFNNKQGVKKLDKKLRKKQVLNPGSIADLTFGSILILLLKDEVRP